MSKSKKKDLGDIGTHDQAFWWTQEQGGYGTTNQRKHNEEDQDQSAWEAKDQAG